MFTYDDTNVCFMHGTLCGGCVCQRAIATRGEKTTQKQLYYICALISNVSNIILSCPSTQFYLFIDVAFLLY